MWKRGWKSSANKWPNDECHTMNDGAIDDWVYTGRGVSPTLRWSFTVDAPLIDIRLGRETGEVIAADADGVLSLLDRRGRVQSQSRTRHQYQRVAWSDNGTAGAAAYDNVMVGWFDRKLQFAWTREMPDEVTAISIDPHGTHLAIAMANGVNMVVSAENKKYSRFESVRPLRYIQLLPTSRELIGAADHGLVGRYALTGNIVWTEKAWSNVGDMAATADGRHVFLAGFTHGAQLFDGQAGKSRGSFVSDGTVNLIACGFTKKHLVVSTLERQLFFINDDGGLLWHLAPPEDITRVLMSPLGDWIICGFASGRIIRLDNSR